MKNDIKDKLLTTTPNNRRKNNHGEDKRRSMDNDETECVKGEDQKTRVTSTHVGR